MSALSKLMQARITLQGIELNKSGHNKFAGYKYFELGDFLPTIQGVFFDLNLAGVISFMPDIATLTITDLDDNSSVVINSPMSSAALKGCHEVQNLGAVQTYIRRYLWTTALEIVEHDALDATTGKDKQEPEKKDKPDEKKDWALNEAMTIAEMLSKGNTKQAVEHLARMALSETEKLLLWNLLDKQQQEKIRAYKGEK